MVYAYDRNILMPTKDLYDTQIMAMALNVAKDEYNKAEKRLDDLTELYSDFYSPSDVDMARWQEEVVNPIKNQIDDLYARGIDPLRSAEGHALLAKTSRNLPYDKINMLKQSSKVLQKNLENAAELQAKNLYDPEYVKFLDRDPKTWDTLKRGVFLWASPSPAYSMETLISPMYKDRQARPLTQEEVEGEGVVYDPMKNYTGYLQSDIMENAKKNLPAFLNTTDGQYQKYLAAQQVAKEQGIDPKLVSDADANERLLENMAGAANSSYIAPNGDIDKIKLEDYKAQKQLDTYKKLKAVDYYYSTRNPNPTNSKTKYGKYRGDFEDLFYDHLTTLANNGSDLIQEIYLNSVGRDNVVVGKNVDGTNKTTKVLVDKNTGRSFAVVEDKSGNIDGADFGAPGKKYRPLDEKERLAYVIANLDPYQQYQRIRIKDQYNTSFDYLKSSVNSTNTEGQFPDLQGVKEDIYNIDGVMARAYGSNYTGNLPKLQSDTITITKKNKRGKEITTTVNIEDCYYEPTGHSISVIMDDSRNNKKEQYEEIHLYEKDKEGNKIGKPIATKLHQIGEYKLDDEGYWSPTYKWDGRMMPGNVNVTKETGVNESPFIKNKK